MREYEERLVRDIETWWRYSFDGNIRCAMIAGYSLDEKKLLVEIYYKGFKQQVSTALNYMTHYYSEEMYGQTFKSIQQRILGLMREVDNHIQMQESYVSSQDIVQKYEEPPPKPSKKHTRSRKNLLLC